MEEREQKNGNRVILILLLLLLLGSIGFNVYQLNQGKKKEVIVQKEMVESQNLRDTLQNELKQINSELEAYRGKNNEMDAVIQEKERELSATADRINKLLKDNKITYNKYLRAKDEVDMWRYNAEKYLAQVTELSKENAKLKEENTSLNSTVKEKVKENDRLTDQNINLTNKVSLGAQLKAESINVQGVRMSGGKERETSKISKLDKIRICFNLPENHVADNGNRDVYVKITDPSNQPVYLESAGGGKFQVEGKDATYTSKDQIFYDNVPKNYCIYWNSPKDAHLKDGTYTVELFTEGYKMGEKNFTLK